jgi:predicted HTH transcriptional regulator
MKAADLDILLQEGEGVMLEYKEGLPSSFARELVAFANTAGGRILLGVRDDGTGIQRMRDEAHDQRCPAPIFEENGFFTAIFYPNPEVRAQVGAMEEPKTAHVPHMYPASTPQVTHQVGTK